MTQSINLEVVRAELKERIDALGVRAPHIPVADLAPEIDAIRAIAHQNGLNPAVTVAHFVDHALSRGERGGLHGWLTMLKEAVASERMDLDACDGFAAACSVHLAG